jgi:phage repressor protein C with HTH and peptisase S24 domain
MKSTVNQRLVSVIEHLTNGNEKRFADGLGVSPAVINNYTTGKQQSKPGFEMLARIAETHPAINIEWLISGRGEMLKPASPDRVLVATQDLTGNLTVPLINRRAAANYLAQGHSQEYFEQLDALVLPGPLLRGGQHYALQVSGDSMAPTLHDGDLVICRLLEAGRWADATNGEVYVLASQNRGLQVKRVQNRLAQGYFRCLSDNPAHSPFDLEADNLLEMWQVRWKLSSNLANAAADLQTRLEHLAHRVEKLEERELL